MRVKVKRLEAKREKIVLYLLGHRTSDQRERRMNEIELLTGGLASSSLLPPPQPSLMIPLVIFLFLSYPSLLSLHHT